MQNLLDASLLHYFHVLNPVIIFRDVRESGISFSSLIISVCVVRSDLQFLECWIIVLSQRLCRSEGSLQSSFHSSVKLFGKKESVRNLKTVCRSLKFLKAKGALGRMLCCFAIKRIFYLRKNRRS